MKTLRRTLAILVFVPIAVSLAAAQTPLRLVNVTPCRLVDTRSQNGGAGFQGTMVFNLPQLAQNGGNMGQCAPFSLSSALAYSVNVTLVPVNGQPVGYLTIWPTGEPQPLVSLLNSDGRIKANAAIVPAGTSGEVSVYVTNTTNVLIDIDAYFASPSAAPTALAFFPVTPCRIVDTRNGQDGGTLQGRQERDYTIPGNCGIPSTAAAYSFNVTALPTQGELQYLTVWPKGEAMPVVSTLNDYTGTIVANAAIVPAGSENATAFYPFDEDTDLLLDVNGYFAPASSGSNPLSLYNVTPCRLLDTRNGIGLFNGTIPIGVVGGACGIPGFADQAFVFNATVVPDGDLLFLTLWPEGLSQPTVSTLNANDGAITSNMAIVPSGTGNDSINAYAPSDTQLILDISSYFAPITTLSVETSALPNATQNTTYSAPLVAIGGVAPYTWTISSGNLPSGLNLSSSGTISGTPTSTGNSNFTVKATDSNSPASTATMNLSITVGTSAGTPTITTTTLPAGTVNTPYSVIVAANGGFTPYTWSILSGVLPTGLSLNASTGQISGTPGAAGMAQFTVQVSDNQHNVANQALAILVDTGDANGTLNGTYALSFRGYDNSNWFVAAGSFTADGNGHITAGETDTNNISTGVQHATITSGTYTIGANGLGQINWTNSSGGNVSLLVSTAAAEDMRIIGFNQNGSGGTWGAGALHQQNPSDFNPGALAGNWAFGFQGVDPSGNPLAADGAYQETSSGEVINGIEDLNDFGTHEQTTFSGGATGGIDANGRVPVQYNVSGLGTVHLATYVISGSEVVGIGVDGGGPLYVTSGVRQIGSFNQSSLNGYSIGRGSRKAKANSDNPQSEALVLQLVAGGGNLTVNEDLNSGGTFEQASQSGTYTVSSNSRTALNFSGGAEIVCYLITTNEGFCINAIPASGSNVNGAELIYFQPQSAGPFSDASYAGEYLGGSLPQYLSGNLSQIDSNVSSGAGSFTSTYTWSGPGGTQQNQTFNGVYGVDTTTGAITFSVNGNEVYAGYIVSPTEVEYVTATQGSNPLVLIEATSSAPRHH